jgi:WD40 repeat protein
MLGLACNRAPVAPDAPDAGGLGGGAGGPGGTGSPGGTGGGGSGAGGAPLPGSVEANCPRIQPGSDSFSRCGRTYSLAYSPDGQFLAAGLELARPNVALWRIADGALVGTMYGDGGARPGGGSVTWQVSFSPDSKLLATASSGNPPLQDSAQQHPDVVQVWDVASRALVRTIPANCGSAALTTAFSPDGTLLVTAGWANLVEIWRVADGTRATSIPYPTKVHNARFSPDGAQVIVAGEDRRATVWNVADGSLAMTLTGTGDKWADAAFSPDGREIATIGPNFTLQLWDAASGGLRQSLVGHDMVVSHVLWVNQNLLVSNDKRGTIIVWRRTAAGDLEVSDIWGTGGESLGIAVSPDQRFLAAGGIGSGEYGFYFIPLE